MIGPPSGATPRRYLPGFIPHVDDGRAGLLNVVVEIKGFRRGDAQLMAETMRALWAAGDNNLGHFGHWAFAEFAAVFEIDARSDELIESLAQPMAITEAA